MKHNLLKRLLSVAIAATCLTSVAAVNTTSYPVAEAEVMYSEP